MLSVLDVYLRPSGLAPPAPIRGHHAHALFLKQIQASQPELSAELHAPQQKCKPFTVSVTREPEGRRVILRATTTDDSVLRSLLSWLQRSNLRQVELGANLFQVDDAVISAQAHLKTLWANALPIQFISFDFLSPTTFCFGDQPGGRKQLLPLPDPGRLFYSLRQKWNTAVDDDASLCRSGLTLDANWRERLDSQTMLVDARIHTEEFQLKYDSFTGFVGSCTFEVLSRDLETRRVASALAAFAFFSGVGYKTTMGMGRAQPRTVPRVQRSNRRKRVA